MPMFDETTQKQLGKVLEGLINPVKVIFFKGDNEKSKETEEFVKEFINFSSKLSLIEYHIDDHKDQVEDWGVFASPAIFITTENEDLKGVGFYGTPGGYEINSFLMSLLEVSGKVDLLSTEHQAIIDSIKNPVYLYAYISLTCPQCPQAVMNIHRLAIENSNIKSFMVEGSAFKEYSEKFGITAFPTIIVGNKEQELIGENAKDLNKLIQLFV